MRITGKHAGILRDAIAASFTSYEELQLHLGDLDWELDEIVPNIYGLRVVADKLVRHARRKGKISILIDLIEGHTENPDILDKIAPVKKSIDKGGATSAELLRDGVETHPILAVVLVALSSFLLWVVYTFNFVTPIPDFEPLNDITFTTREDGNIDCSNDDVAALAAAWESEIRLFARLHFIGQKWSEPQYTIKNISSKLVFPEGEHEEGLDRFEDVEFRWIAYGNIDEYVTKCGGDWIRIEENQAPFDVRRENLTKDFILVADDRNWNSIIELFMTEEVEDVELAFTVTGHKIRARNKHFKVEKVCKLSPLDMKYLFGVDEYGFTLDPQFEGDRRRKTGDTLLLGECGHLRKLKG